MSFSISFTDLRLIKELSNLSDYDMLQLRNDNLMLKHLHTVGLDLDYGFAYVPSVHRNMQNKVVTSYRVCGDVRCDRNWRNGPMSSLTDRMVAAGFTDVSLAEELGMLTGLARMYGGKIGNEGEDMHKEALPDNQLEDDWQGKEKEIIKMAVLCENLRGGYFKECGGLKGREDYAQTYNERKQIKGSK